MPRTPIDAFWIEKIYTLRADNPRRGARAIKAQLERIGREIDRSDWPEERTIAKYISTFDRLPEHEKQRYHSVYWPETFERGILPWEAAAACLELLNEHQGKERPTVRLARWFWRVTLAAPDAPAFYRRNYAGWLAAAEIVGTGNANVSRYVEAALQYAPWRSSENERRYKKAMEKGEIPLAEIDIPVKLYKEVKKDLLGTE